MGHTLRGQGAANSPASLCRAGPWTSDTWVWKARSCPRTFHTQHRRVAGAPQGPQSGREFKRQPRVQTYLQPFSWTLLRTALAGSRMPPSRAPRLPLHPNCQLLWDDLEAEPGRGRAQALPLPPPPPPPLGSLGAQAGSQWSLAWGEPWGLWVSSPPGGRGAFCSCCPELCSPGGGDSVPGSVPCRCPPWSLARGHGQLRAGGDRFSVQRLWEPPAPWGGWGVGSGDKRVRECSWSPELSASPSFTGILVPTAQIPICARIEMP